MRKDIQLETTVTSAEFDEQNARWTVHTDGGETVRCRYFISAMGLISSTQGHYEFDILVLATGFDALTGALDRLSITGRDGLALKEKWRAGPNTFMGVSVHGFPNLFMITGPQAPFANLPTTIEQDIRWIARCIQAMEKEGYATAEPQNYFDKLDESAEAGFPELQFSRRDGAETAAG